jgi:hypothetical protein
MGRGAPFKSSFAHNGFVAFCLRVPSPTSVGFAAHAAVGLRAAILADHFGDGRQALAIYQQFKFSVVAGLPKRRWKLNSRDIDQASAAIRKENAENGGAL